MKRIIFTTLFVALLSACSSLPSNFTYRYAKTDTGLSKRIHIDGYYVAEHGCDSTFYSIFMFYPDGLFRIATTSEISADLIACFTQGGKSKLCKYPLWGVYVVEGDLIRTQTLRPEGGGCTIFRDYRIVADGQIVNVSDYVEPEHTRMGYMRNYPSYRENAFARPAMFYAFYSMF